MDIQSMKYDNFQHCLRSVFTLKNFSELKFVNRFYTKVSSFWFVGSRWRKYGLILAFSSIVIPIIELGYSAIIGAPNWAKPWPIALFLLGTPLLVSWGVFWFRVSKFINPKRFGRPGTQQISNKLMFDKTKIKPGRVHSSTLKATAGKKMIHIGNGDNQNLIEFDVDMSTLLLESNITIDTDEKKRIKQRSESDIIKASSKYIDIQAKALNLLTDNAIEAGTSFFNAKKISLGSLVVKEGKASCELGSTSYFCSKVTNDLAAKCFVDHDDFADDKPFSMFPARADGDNFILQPFSLASHLSNHIGSMVLAVSRDGYPVLCKQKHSSMENPGKAVLSGSGSLEYSDIMNSGGNVSLDLGDVIRYGMARELLEETGGIAQDSYRKKDRDTLRSYAKRIQLVGYYRDIRRGAFPIFVGFCRMSADFETILKRAADEPCLWKSATETVVLNSLPDRKVANSKQMEKYLDDYIDPSQDVKQNRDIIRDASDQVLITRELLKLLPVKQHFNAALALPLK